MPAAHVVQAAAPETPVPFEYVPAAQEAQPAELRDPVPVQYVPAGQLPHPFVVEYVPAGHTHTVGKRARTKPEPPLPPESRMLFAPPPPLPVLGTPSSPLLEMEVDL